MELRKTLEYLLLNTTNKGLDGNVIFAWTKTALKTYIRDLTLWEDSRNLNKQKRQTLIQILVLANML